MSVRTSSAVWNGGLKEGRGKVRLKSGWTGDYSFDTRMGDQPGPNPEELIGGALASCFSMALGAGLEKAGHKPEHIATDAEVVFEKAATGYEIARIKLRTRGRGPGLDEVTFRSHAEEARSSCPVARALAATPIDLDAALE